MSIFRTIREAFLALASVSVVFSATASYATDRTWTGTTSTVWSVGTNWGGTAPTVAADNALFTGTFVSGRQPQVQAVTTIGGIWMTGTLGQNTTITRNSTNSLTLSGNTINSIAGLGILVDNTDARTLNLNLPVAVANTQEWRNQTNNSVALTNSASIISGAGNLTLRSTGADLASAFRVNNLANTFTGQLTIAEGNLRVTGVNNVSANGPLGNADDTKPVILGEAGNKLGFLRLSDAAASVSTNKPFSLATDGRGGFWVGPAAGTSLTLSGIVSGGGKLVKMGAGDGNQATDLVLSNAGNSWSGGTLITDGYVSIAAENMIGGGVITLDYDPQYVINSGQGHSGVAGLKFTDDTLLDSSTKSIVINNGIGGVGGIIEVTAGTGSTLSGTGVLSGAGPLTKAGAAPLTIAGDISGSFTGTTTVATGLLNVTGCLGGNGSDKVFIAPGSFGATDAMLTRSVAALAAPNEYAGLGSTIRGGSFIPTFSTAADILLGTNTAGGSDTVSMEWRLRTAGEIAGTTTSPPMPFLPHDGLVSDVLRLSGMGNGGGLADFREQTDIFTLQMTYNPDALPGGLAVEGALASEGAIYLAWLNTDSTLSNGIWVHAIDGNFGIGASAVTHVLSSWNTFASANGITDATTLAPYLGSWGVDTVNHKVWAVVNHNSDFAVVPEPSSFVLVLFGLVGIGFHRRGRWEK